MQQELLRTGERSSRVRTAAREASDLDDATRLQTLELLEVQDVGGPPGRGPKRVREPERVVQGVLVRVQGRRLVEPAEHRVRGGEATERGVVVAGAEVVQARLGVE